MALGAPRPTYKPQDISTLDQEIFQEIFDFVLEQSPDWENGVSESDPSKFTPLYKKFLSPTAINHFFAWYLSQDLQKELEEYKQIQRVSIPNTLEDFSLVKSFRKQKENTLKETDTHSLTWNEYQKARAYLEKNPKIQDIFFTIDAAFRAYFYSLRIYLNEKAKQSENQATIKKISTKTIDKLETSGLFFRGIIEELMPFMAHYVQNDQTPLEKSWAEALSEGLGNRSIFTAIDPTNKEIITCPIKQLIGFIIHAKFDHKPDGSFEYNPNQQELSGLMTNIMHALNKSEKKPEDQLLNHG